MATKMKIKKNDTVVVIAGKDKGKTGMVKAAYPKESRVVVVGVNLATRHTKPSQTDPQGGRKRIEASIHVSNVALIAPTDKKPPRVGFKTTAKGEKQRVAKRSGEVIE